MSEFSPHAPSGLASESQEPSTASTALPAVIGALFVTYGYLGGLWLTRHGPTPELLNQIRAWVNIPFGIGDDFGVLGIALLLTTAGYQASAAVAARSVERLTRTRRSAWLGPAITLGGLFSVAFAGYQWAEWGAVIGHLLCAGGLVLMGHVLRGHDSARLGAWPTMLLALGCLANVILVSSGYSGISVWYPLVAVYALLIFLLARSHGHRLAATRPVQWLGSRGYVPAESSSTRDRAGYLHGLDVLRVIASTLVVYTHVANWYSTREHSWVVSDWVDTALIKPLHLNPAASFLGVGTFLLISGTVVTRVADRETPTQFLSRRLSRIAPLLVVSGVAAWCLTNLGVFAAASGQDSPNLLDLLLGTTLAGFFTTPELVLLGVTWTLVVQIAFYMYVAGTIPLLRGRAWVPPALLAALECFMLSLVSDESGVAAHRLGIVAAYLPVLCLGQLITLVRAGKVHPAAASAIGLVHVSLFVWADKLGVYFDTGDSHPRTLLLVFGLVVLAMNVRGPISRSRIVRQWASRTYAIYLLHPLCIYPMMDWLSPHLGTSLSLVCAISVLVVATELAHRLVERPFERWLRARRRDGYRYAAPG